VGESGSAELAELAALVRERNAVEARIARLLERPANTGWMGEWIAARIFDIELEPSANAAGYDGQFTIGALAGKTVNIKTYTRDERMLDMNSPAPCDYYLVLAGPRGVAASARGTVRPFCIERVFLFDSPRLRRELESQGVKIREATSVRAAHWDAAEIFPRSTNPLMVLSELQRRQLAMFCDRQYR
jgi:hypothetical protein